MPFDFGASFGSFDFDVSSFSAADLGSAVDNFGTEYVNVSDFTEFNVPYEDIGGFGGYEQVGSFAGNAAWYDVYNTGNIIDGPVAAQTPGFGDSVTRSLGGAPVFDAVPIPVEAVPTDTFGPLLTPDGVLEVGERAATGLAEPTLTVGQQIQSFAQQVQTDFAGFIKGSQQALAAYQKVAPLVNVVTAALKIPNPVNQLIQPFQQAVGIAGQVSQGAGAVASIGNIKTTPGVVRGADGIYTVPLGEPIGPAQSNAPVSVNAGPPAGYNAAVITVQELAPSQVILNDRLLDQDVELVQRRDALNEYQAELTDPELTEDRRQFLAVQIQIEQNDIARLEDERNLTAETITQNATQLSAAQRIIDSTNTSVITVPGAVPGTLRELSVQETAELQRKTLDPRLVNSFVDNGLPVQTNYKSAVNTVQQLAPAAELYRNEIASKQIEIGGLQKEIQDAQDELANNQELTEDQRNELQFEITGKQDQISRLQQDVEQNSQLLLETNQQLLAASEVIATTNASATAVPQPVTGVAQDQFRTVYDPITNTYSIFNTANNTTVSTGLTQQQALATAAQIATALTGIGLNVATPVSSSQDPVVRAAVAAALAASLVATNSAAGNVVTQQNSITTGLIDAARNQQSIRNLRNNKAQSSDWRVRLRLAPNATYLYKDPMGAGILAPLAVTDGVIFPYTPSIETAYKANYDPYDLTHSNYRGYFYRNSYVDAINVRATFTAQDTNEANYLLAVIHFFRSVTKMFYGQTTVLRGAPPPLVYLNGHGDFQFTEHPCVVSQFNYTLPPDVDYIRAQNTMSNNTNLQLSRIRNTIANNPLAYSVNRLLNSKLLPGALDFRPSTTNNLADGGPTYVPTKMEISISLFPIQSRSQISQNFNNSGFANGNLVKGGYW